MPGRWHDQGAAGWDPGHWAEPDQRAKQGVKRSRLSDAAGVSLAIGIAGANRPDLTLALDTLDDIVVPRPKPSLEFPQGLCLDKGDDALWLRWEVLRRQYDPHVRTRGEEITDHGADPGKKARRWPLAQAQLALTATGGAKLR